eukprot:3970400-Pyramimonas_sp.AAC.1
MHGSRKNCGSSLWFSGVRAGPLSPHLCAASLTRAPAPKSVRTGGCAVCSRVALYVLRRGGVQVGRSHALWGPLQSQPTN